MSLLQDLNEHLNKYVWPAVKEIEGPEGEPQTCIAATFFKGSDLGLLTTVLPDDASGTTFQLYLGFDQGPR